jgi:hypothetical protein
LKDKLSVLLGLITEEELQPLFVDQKFLLRKLVNDGRFAFVFIKLDVKIQLAVFEVD